MKKTDLDCSIVILSYNSKEVTDHCLSRVTAAIEHSKKILNNNIQVIVVDNASQDGSVEMIKKKHSYVQLKALTKNIGYAAGNNLAMKSADTPFILLMNSDTYIEIDSIIKALTYLRDHNGCDIVVGRCVYANRVLQLYGGYLPNPTRIIAWSFGLESIPVLKSYLPRIYGFDREYYDHEGRMEWCPPSFFTLRKKVYETTSGFDENLWFHMVDAEWCHRIHQRGYTICFTPTIEVVHLGGASSKGLEAKLIKDNFKGLMHFCRKHYPEKIKTIAAFLKIGLKIRSYFYYLARKKDLARVYDEISREINGLTLE